MNHAPAILMLTPNTAVDRVVEAPGLSLGGHVKARRLDRYPAGKGVNVCRALARLGVGSTAGGFVGQNEVRWFNDFIEHQSSKAALIRPCFTPVAGATRENITLIDPATQTDTHLREAGFEVTGEDLQELVASLQAWLREIAAAEDAMANERPAGEAPAPIVAICGSLPRGMDASDVVELAIIAAAAGGRMAVDLNGADLRNLVQDLTEKAGAPSGAAATPPLWLAKPNLEELAALTGDDAAPPSQQTDIADGAQAIRDLARPLLNLCQWVVVSLGDAGAWLLSRDQAWRGRLTLAADERVVSTVGCGDCMAAALIHRLASVSPDPADALTHAIAVATANALTPDIARFDLATVRELRNRVRIDLTNSDHLPDRGSIHVPYAI